jgi:phytoene synthase
MSALYAYCREVDDIADEEEIPLERRREQLTDWREQTRRACNGGQVTLPVILELQSAIQRYDLPWKLFDDLLLGVEADLVQTRYATFADLEEYCYRVASAVGLLSIRIFGHRNEKCADYALALGKALQFTNILRDVGNDAQRDRIYLPTEALRQYGVSEEQIMAGHHTPGFFELAKDFARRADCFYRQARATLPHEDRRSMIAAELMGAVYWQLLKRLEADDYRVLGSTPTKLTKQRKAGIILRAWLRHLLWLDRSAYGD